MEALLAVLRMLGATEPCLEVAADWPGLTVEIPKVGTACPKEETFEGATEPVPPRALLVAALEVVLAELRMLGAAPRAAVEAAVEDVATEWPAPRARLVVEVVLAELRMLGAMPLAVEVACDGGDID